LVSKGEKVLRGALLDVDYLNKGEESVIRLTVKGMDGKAYAVFDDKFKPYFYLVPSKNMDDEMIQSVSTVDNNKTIKAQRLEKVQKTILGKSADAYKVFVSSTSYVPKLSAAMGQYGTCYEYDIPFAKRYSVDKELIPLTEYKFDVDERDGMLFLKSFEKDKSDARVPLNIMCFDIEVYNPIGGMPRMEKDLQEDRTPFCGGREGRKRYDK
jgi:DNA polymerase elongation subunit (family B)